MLNWLLSVVWRNRHGKTPSEVPLTATFPESGYVAVHKEFDREHRVVSTMSLSTGGTSQTLDQCRLWCDKANANGFNYRPYLADDVTGLLYGNKEQTP